jgi:hypothetical protein
MRKCKSSIKLTVEVEYERGEKNLPIPQAFVAAYDLNDCFITSAPVRQGLAQLNIPVELDENNIRLFHAATEFALDKAPTLARLKKVAAVEKRVFITTQVPELRVKLPRLDLKFWIPACCRVKGKVFRSINMPNGKVRKASLCNARILIFDVDHTWPFLIAKIPNDLVFRLRDELMTAFRDPLVLAKARYNLAVADAGFRRVNPDKEKHEEKCEKAGDERILFGELLANFKLNDAARLRNTFVKNFGIINPYLCYFDWLFHFHKLDLLKTVDIDEKGCFDTHIYYPCYGDKPDLYFKVQQDCHPEGWLTIYEPPIHCNTYWNYCCGTEIEINVTHSKAAPGLSLTPCVFPYDKNDPAVMGESKELNYEVLFNVANAALLHTGEVLFLPGHGHGGVDVVTSAVWNPASEEIADFTTPPPDDQVKDALYCCGHAFLADGRLLTIGGGGNSAGNAIKSAWTFEPHSRKWTKVKDMKHKRWYPTAVTLPDGRVLAVSGKSPGNVTEVEVYDPVKNEWKVVTGADYDKFTGTYPGLHLLPSEEVFFTRTGWDSHAGTKSAVLKFTGETSGAWEEKYEMEHPDRHAGMSVILLREHEYAAPGPDEDEPVPLDPPIPYAKILVIGGGGGDRFPATGIDPCPEGNMVEMIDLPPLSGDPTWKEVDHLKYKRCDVNAVLLPDGTVLACGGVSGTTAGCEIYDPDEDKWTEVASLKNVRKYHSVALLLPSGKVLITGGNTADKMKIELYSPPYFFRGPRPSYDIPDHHFHHDANFTIETPDACRIQKVALIRPSAVTHQTDSEQRYIPLSFERQGKCQLKIRAPKNGAIAPPGHYMLFIVDDCGVPSKAQFIDLH